MIQAPAAFRQPAPAPAPADVVQGPFRLRLWLPLTPLFWALAPFVVLLAPLLLLAPPLWRMNPYVAALAIGRVLVSLNGVDVDVDTPEARVRIKIL